MKYLVNAIKEILAFSIEEIAKDLAKDMSLDSLKRYVAEQKRMVENEKKYGRSPRKYEKLLKAGELALTLKQSE